MECQNSVEALRYLKTLLPRDIISIVKSYFRFLPNYEEIKNHHDAHCSSLLIQTSVFYDEKEELFSMVQKNNKDCILVPLVTREFQNYTEEILNDATSWLIDMANIAQVNHEDYEIFWSTKNVWTQGYIISVIYTGHKIYSLQVATAHLISLINSNWWKIEEYIDKQLCNDASFCAIPNEVSANHIMFVKALDKLKNDIAEDGEGQDIIKYINMLYLTEENNLHIKSQKST